MESGAPGLPEPMTCPEVQQTLLPVPRPMLTWFQLPTSLGAAATCTESSGSPGQRSGAICRHKPLLLCVAPKLALGVSPSLSGVHCVTLSLPLGLSLSRLRRLAVQQCPLLSTPEPSPRRRSRRGLQGLGAMTSAWGAGCATHGSVQSTGHPAGGRAPGSLSAVELGWGHPPQPHLSPVT